ncbi:MAG: type II toxin-antitoxin system VapC family toxin [Prevotellaceae bacterium]|nr:type II toxin-antitoxin system VapC family toxin [Prevotellaceae bacterium]
MRVYLDTNIVVFLLSRDRESISRDTNGLITDPENLLYTSTECVRELIHLRQIGKILRSKGRGDERKRRPIMDMIKDFGIEIVPITEKHLRVYDCLPFIGEHRDPADRLIIAQAVSDRALLVSCDHAFNDYTANGLRFHFNQR